METFSKLNFYIIIFFYNEYSFELKVRNNFEQERYKGCKTSLELLYGLKWNF